MTRKMAGKKETKDPFEKFFKEDKEEFFDKSESHDEELTFKQSSELPVMPQSELAQEGELVKEWKSIRKFFVSNKGKGLSGDYKSLYINKFPDSIKHSVEYPFLVSENPEYCSGLYQIIDHLLEVGLGDQAGDPLDQGLALDKC